MSRSEKLLGVIGDDIRQDCEDYARLRDLMQAQYQNLLQRDGASIESANQTIDALVEAARVRAQRRSKILAAFRLSADAAGMQRLIESRPEPVRNQLAQAWSQAGVLAGECKQLNERNGALLAMQQDILKQLLGGEDNRAQLYAP